MSLTITEYGQAITEEIDGVVIPADYSFESVNDFVHNHNTQYEDLQCLCLGMACHAERLQRLSNDHARYEALRILNPREYAELWSRALRGERFDDLVDELVKAKNES